MIVRLLVVGDETLCERVERLVPDGVAMSGVPRFSQSVEGGVAADLVVISLRDAGDAAATVERASRVPGSPGTIFLTEDESPELRAQLLAVGATAVINSGLDDDLIRAALAAVIGQKRKAGSTPSRRLPGGSPLDWLVAESPAMRAVIRIARRVARAPSSVLILGETGVGKEAVARAMHLESERAEGPFVAVNCAAVPETLIESELFGHERGAFTGADRGRRGQIELAHGGSFFLDEVGDASPAVQAKLLRVLQDHEVHPVGSTKPVHVDVRFIAATHHDLESDLSTGEFREDLYYRLSVVTIRIPPLRERPEDTPVLAQRIAEDLGPSFGRAGARFTDAAIDELLTYSWPGNVRELHNVVERALLLSESPVLRLDAVRLPERHTEDRTTADRWAEVLGEGWEDLDWHELKHIAIDRLERRYLTHLLRASEGRVGVAAERAGVDPRSLFDRLKHHGLRKEDFRKH